MALIWAKYFSDYVTDTFQNSFLLNKIATTFFLCSLNALDANNNNNDNDEKKKKQVWNMHRTARFHNDEIFYGN